MIGVRSKINIFSFSSPSYPFISFNGIFDRTVLSDSAIITTSNVALKSGSSKQGRAFRASQVFN